MEIGNIDLLLESITFGPVRNKLLRNRFLKHDAIVLIPNGGPSGNGNYSKKSLIWLEYRELADRSRIMHGRNGREYRLPKLPKLIVDGFCAETQTVYKFLGCFWHGHTCLPFHDVCTMFGKTMAERFEQTTDRFEQITQAGYQVVVQWECEFVDEILARQAEMKKHSVFDHDPLNTRMPFAEDGRMPCVSTIRCEKGNLFSIVTSCHYLYIANN